MPQSLATLEAVTKAIYSGKLRKQLNDDVVALRRIKRTNDGIVTEVGGKYVTFPIHTRRNTGIGARNENEPLPRAGKQSAAVARIGLKYQYAALELTGQAIRLADKDYQSFISAVEFETDRVKVDTSLDLNRQVYGDGTGTIAKITTTTGTVTTFGVNSTDLLQDDELIDIVNGTTGAIIAAGRTITAINDAAKTITISGAGVVMAANQVITRQGNWGREWLGFEAALSTGVYENIDPATERVWTGNVMANGGTERSISEGLLNQMTDTIKKRGSKTTALFTTYEIQRAYANLLQQQRSYVNANGNFDGGYKSLAYNTPYGEIPIVVDIMAPKGNIYFVDEGSIKVYQEHDWQFMEFKGGDVWIIKQEGGETYDAYTAKMSTYSNLGTDRRSSFGVIRDVAGA